MPLGTLTGHALKMIPGIAEHTYVTSSLGQVWACFGRSVGGRLICASAGNTAQAECLSQPNSEAGIVYGGTGVCHQAANRILLPSGQNVSGASGYRGSFWAWGSYGRDLVTRRTYSPLSFPWPELEACRTLHVHF